MFQIHSLYCLNVLQSVDLRYHNIRCCCSYWLKKKVRWRRGGDEGSAFEQREEKERETYHFQS